MLAQRRCAPLLALTIGLTIGWVAVAPAAPPSGPDRHGPAVAPGLLASARPATVGETTLAPRLERGPGGLVVAGTAAQAALAGTYAGGLRLGDGDDALAITPVTPAAPSASPELVGGAAAVYSDAAPSTDVIVRPTALGLEAFAQLRGAAAPEVMTWHLDLADGQSLQPLSDGGIAVVERGDVGDAAPGPDPQPAAGGASNAGSLDDTARQLADGQSAVDRAQAETGDEAIAVITAPWAQDARGREVPTKLRLDGDDVTLEVRHRSAGVAYPVIADPQFIDASAADAVTASATSTRRPLRAVTWNTAHLQDSDILADVVYNQVGDVPTDRRGNPVAGVAALEEACLPTVVLAERRLERRTHRRWYHEFAPSATGGPCNAGNAILTTQRITDWQRVVYTSQAKLDAGSPRNYLRASFSVRGVPMRAYVTHLTHRHEDEVVRYGQVAQLDRDAAHFAGPKLIMGDFNTLPTRRVSPDTPATADVMYRHYHEVDEPRNRPTETVKGDVVPSEKFDYQFVSDMTVEGVDVKGQSVSDHDPLVASLLVDRVHRARFRSGGPPPTVQNLARPTIGGSPQPAQTLTADPGQWQPASSDFVYQWCVVAAEGTCTAIDGANDRTYVVRGDDAGRRIAVQATPFGSLLGEGAQSDAVEIRDGGPPVNLSPPGIVLTEGWCASLYPCPTRVDPGTWSGSPELTYASGTCTTDAACAALPQTADPDVAASWFDTGSFISSCLQGYFEATVIARNASGVVYVPVRTDAMFIGCAT